MNKDIVSDTPTTNEQLEFRQISTMEFYADLLSTLESKKEEFQSILYHN